MTGTTITHVAMPQQNARFFGTVRTHATTAVQVSPSKAIDNIVDAVQRQDERLVAGQPSATGTSDVKRSE
jgi:hypothetical protein